MQDYTPENDESRRLGAGFPDCTLRSYGFFLVVFVVIVVFVESTVVVAPVLMPSPVPMAPVVAPVDAPTPGVYVGGVAIAPAVAPAVESYAVLSPRLHAPRATSATTDVAANVNFRVIRLLLRRGFASR